MKVIKKTFDSRFTTKTGWLCLDYANTVDWHASANPEEQLSAYQDLVSWAKSMAILSPAATEELLAESKAEPAKARKILNQAIELREAIYRIFSSHAKGISASVDDILILNAAMDRLLPELKLALNNNVFEWEWVISTKCLDSLLGPVIWSAVGLLTSDALERVGQCADESGCGWLFWDNSRNRSRCWCDMKDCGNRAKSRRFYRKSHDSVK